VQVDHSKYQPMEDKLSLKDMQSHHVIHFKLLFPLNYLWNGLSQRLQILYTSWLCEILTFRLSNTPSSGPDHGHVTCFNFGK